MKQFILIDGAGFRFAEFEAADKWKAWRIAVRLAAYPKPRPRTWSLLIERDDSHVYMGGVGLAPKRTETKVVDARTRYFNDGDLLRGVVVRDDHEGVLVDVGYKVEGLIRARELSARPDADPHEIVQVGDQVLTLVLHKEDNEGRLILSKKRVSADG